MPLYEYECPKDGTFERMQKFSDPPLTTCPTCGGPVEKLLSAPAIQFKGTGWYVTDYARKSGGPHREKGSEGAKETASSGSSDTKSTSSKDSKASGSSSGSGDKK